LKEDVKILMENGQFCKDMQKNPTCFLGEFDKNCSGTATGDGCILETSNRDGWDGCEPFFGKSHSGDINNKKVPKNTVYPSQPSPLSINFQKTGNYKYDKFSNSSTNITIGIDYLIRVVNEFRNTMISTGNIVDITEFASTILRESDELQGIYTVEQVKEVTNTIISEEMELKSQRGKIKIVKGVIKQSPEYNEIVKYAKIIGIDKDLLDSIMKKLLASGEIMKTDCNSFNVI